MVDLADATRTFAAEHGLARYPKTIVIASVLLTAASLWAAPRVGFDYNILNLQADGTESVVWERKTAAAHGQSDQRLGASPHHRVRRRIGVNMVLRSLEAPAHGGGPRLARSTVLGVLRRRKQFVEPLVEIAGHLQDEPRRPEDVLRSLAQVIV